MDIFTQFSQEISVFHGRNLPGIYVYTLKAGNASKQGKLVIQ